MQASGLERHDAVAHKARPERGRRTKQAEERRRTARRCSGVQWLGEERRWNRQRLAFKLKVGRPWKEGLGMAQERIEARELSYREKVLISLSSGNPVGTISNEDSNVKNFFMKRGWETKFSKGRSGDPSGILDPRNSLNG
ncbi:hypothetical protein PIB30_054925 [Stylosanthes scabra]|uniref:Uncharacterized protein n=1 Tax=Stylosanthes scabra TaxID=79078 RepID=A0ABU6WKK1_9FABA|nr:hypothetical protein [Stylosanthes scabra]